MDKEWINPCGVKNNPWVAEIGSGKVVGDWGFNISPKVKIKDFDNLTYEEAKEFQDEMIDIIIKILDAIKDTFRPVLVCAGSKEFTFEDDEKIDIIKNTLYEQVYNQFNKNNKGSGRIRVFDEITIYGKLLIYMYNENGKIVERWFPEIIHSYSSNTSPCRLFVIHLGGLMELKHDNLFEMTLETFSDLWLKRTIDTEKDNTKLAELNAPKLERIIKQIESIPNFTLCYWGSLANTNKYFKVDKYGFKQ